MYLAFKHSHLLTAALSMLLTVVWAAVAWNSRTGAGSGLTGRTKATYVLHRIIAGLAGLTGLAVTFLGPWRQMLFPYIGLVFFVVHGLAAAISKRTLGSEQDTTKRRTALLIQVAVFLLSAYVMATKSL